MLSLIPIQHANKGSHKPYTNTLAIILEMNRILIIILFFQSICFSQSQEDLFNKSLEFADGGNYTKSIELLDKFIELYPNSDYIHKIYLNRATAKSRNNDYESAYKDYTTAFAIDSTYAEAIRQRGYLSKKFNKYESAIEDYNFALRIDSSLIDTYVNKAFLYQEIGEINNACKNFELALDGGITEYVENMRSICDTTSISFQKITYKILVDKSSNITYGFTLENPIKVGVGPKNQKLYLEALRDVQGNKIEYRRIGVGGYYESRNGLMGIASIDSYEVKYRNKEGNKKTDTLYLTFYDYHHPKIPLGFLGRKDLN